MLVAIAQIDSVLGDVAANVAQARGAIAEAVGAKADLLVFPELALSGYAVARTGEDTTRTVEELRPLAEAAGSTALLVGFHERGVDRTYNSAAYFEHGTLVTVQRKLYLVGHAPFEEASTFAPGERLETFDTVLGRQAVLICNDAWQPALPFLAVHHGARILLMPSNSSTAVVEAEPYWRDLTRFYARMLQCYVVFANRVGSEAGLTYWGGSHVVGPSGDVVAEAPRLEPALLHAELDLDRVAARRAELPLVGDPRIDLLRAEIERLSRRGRRD